MMALLKWGANFGAVMTCEQVWPGMRINDVLG